MTTTGEAIAIAMGVLFWAFIIVNGVRSKSTVPATSIVPKLFLIGMALGLISLIYNNDLDALLLRNVDSLGVMIVGPSGDSKRLWAIRQLGQKADNRSAAAILLRVVGGGNTEQGATFSEAAQFEAARALAARGESLS